MYNNYSFGDFDLNKAQKTDIIQRYFENAQWDDYNISRTKIIQDLAELIGEQPAVEIIEKKTQVVNEANGEVTKIDFVDSVRITFTIGEVQVPDPTGSVLLPSFETSTVEVKI